MEFINRKKELEFLQEAYKLSERKLYSLAIYGLRRVGKTRLVEEFIRGGGLYFFVAKNKTSLSLLLDFQEVLREKLIISEFERFDRWDDFFEIIFKRYNGIVCFDEFQNFLDIDKSVFGILQKFIDLNENRKKLLFVYSGSVIGLVKKLFGDDREPLYGRLKRRLFLKPLSFRETIQMGEKLNIRLEEIAELYFLFGGFPLYYVAIEDEHLEGMDLGKILDRFFLRENAIFEEEVERILSLEFGKRKGRYYDILTAIALGNRTVSEVSSYLSVKETKLTRYINELINYFEIISQEKQVVGSRNLFVINSPIINFWFRFFYKELSFYKLRNKNFIEKVKAGLNSYFGHRFEILCREFFEVITPFEYERIGRQWGKFKGEKGKNSYEIDIVALNEKTKEILFGECKWQEKVNANSILAELTKKAGYVDWHNEKRKERYAVFAKSFSKKISEFDGKKVYCFDLKDIESKLSNPRLKR